MTESAWHLPQRGPGRLYQQARDLTIRYDNRDEVIERIVQNLKGFVQLESAVRLLLDGDRVQPITTVMTVPFEGDNDTIYLNMATVIFEQMWGYYLSADPKSTHHGLTNLVFEGNETSMIRRETEKFLSIVTVRNDFAGRVMRNYKMAADVPPLNRDVYLKQVVQPYMDVHLGVRMYTHGESVNRVTTFLPIEAGHDAIERIYYNLEHIVHQNLVAYDELHDHYLPISQELILREVESVLYRARQKGNTRKKLINGLKLHTVLLEDPAQIHSRSLADLYYDKLNRIDLLEEASQRSRDMFATALIRSTEITTAATNIENLKLEDRVYIDRPPQREAAPATAPAAPARQAPAQEEAPAPAAPHADGLEEL